jgi:hypothetical protein
MKKIRKRFEKKIPTNAEKACAQTTANERTRTKQLQLST